MVSIGKDAARNRLARELVDEVLAECIVCGYPEDCWAHVKDCTGCKAPRDHHEYRPRGGN